MLKNYRNILLTFPILIIAWGCYTTSQHPLVYFEHDESELRGLKISVYDECSDCHNTDSIEEFKAVEKASISAISSYNNEYYSGSDEINTYYNEIPWWFEYKINLISETDESGKTEMIVYRNDNNRIDYNPPPPIYNPPTTPLPPKYREPERDNSSIRNNEANANQKRTDPNPRQRNGGGRGNFNGRK